MYRYFVAFTSVEEAGGYRRFGNAEIASEGPIGGLDDVQAIEERLSEMHGIVRVISWQRFECGPDEKGADA